MLLLAGTPVLERVLGALVESEMLAEVVVATSERNHQHVSDLIRRVGAPIAITAVRGGATRQESVQAGVRALDPACELVLIHDAARPLVSAELIIRAVQSGARDGAVVPGLPVTDTIKRVDRDQVRETLDRSTLVAIQTPQVFRRDWLIDVYERSDPATPATDEASILERAGYPVRVIEGEAENIKITSPSDIVVAEALLAAREVNR